ncbi:MAG: SH3 domain-containing protein [Chloroflexales bacterium]
MPPKADPRDWDRYFRPGAPRRSGPLRALANIILICVALGILGGATIFAWSYGRERARESAATNASLVETSNAAVIATRTAKSLDTTVVPATSAAVVATPNTSPEAPTGHGSVTNGGNLRSQPVVSAETVIGQVCAGDKIDFLEERTLSDGTLWYRIRLTESTSDCAPQRVTVGSIGWASATLLTKPTP